MDHSDHVPIIIVFFAIVVGTIAPATAHVIPADETEGEVNVTTTTETGKALSSIETSTPIVTSTPRSTALPKDSEVTKSNTQSPLSTAETTPIQTKETETTVESAPEPTEESIDDLQATARRDDSTNSGATIHTLTGTDPALDTDVNDSVRTEEGTPAKSTKLMTMERGTVDDATNESTDTIHDPTEPDRILGERANRIDDADEDAMQTVEKADDATQFEVRSDNGAETTTTETVSTGDDTVISTTEAVSDATNESPLSDTVTSNITDDTIDDTVNESANTLSSTTDETTLTVEDTSNDVGDTGEAIDQSVPTNTHSLGDAVGNTSYAVNDTAHKTVDSAQPMVAEQAEINEETAESDAMILDGTVREVSEDVNDTVTTVSNITVGTEDIADDPAASINASVNETTDAVERTGDHTTGNVANTMSETQNSLTETMRRVDSGADTNINAPDSGDYTVDVIDLTNVTTVPVDDTTTLVRDSTDSVETTVNGLTDSDDGSTDTIDSITGSIEPPVDETTNSVGDSTAGVMASGERMLDGTTADIAPGSNATFDTMTDLTSGPTRGVTGPLGETTRTADDAVTRTTDTTTGVVARSSTEDNITMADIRAFGAHEGSRKGNVFSSPQGDSTLIRSESQSGVVDELTGNAGDASHRADTTELATTASEPDVFSDAVENHRSVPTDPNRVRPRQYAEPSDVSGADTALGVTAILAAVSLVPGLVAKSSAFVPPPGTTGGLQTAVQSATRAGIARVRRVIYFPGYSRNDDSDPLENENRLAIYEEIDRSPGIHLAKLVSATDCSMRTVRYHCRILIEEGLISKEMMNGKKRLYPIDSDRRELLAALTDEARTTILLGVADQEPVTVSRLAFATDRAPSTVTYHLKNLEADGLVERRRSGKSVETRLSHHVRAYFEESMARPRTDQDMTNEDVITVGEGSD